MVVLLSITLLFPSMAANSYASQHNCSQLPHAVQGSVLKLWLCDSSSASQTWGYGKDKTIRPRSKMPGPLSHSCVDILGYSTDDDACVFVDACHTDDKQPAHQNQEWSLNSNGTITSQISGKCLWATDYSNGGRITIQTCSTDPTLTPNQQFSFNRSTGVLRMKNYPSWCVDNRDVAPGPRPTPGPPSPQSKTQHFTVDLAAPTNKFSKPFLQCIGSSHLAMGILNESSADGHPTPIVGQLWRQHLKLVREELGIGQFRAHGLYIDDGRWFCQF